MADMISLKENRDFRRLYGKGKSFVSPVVVTYLMKTSKKIGKAVQRNRSRRVIREAFRLLSPRIKPGYDFVFVARGKTPYVKSGEVKDALEAQLKKAGVLL